jgi:hypothetical protein
VVATAETTLAQQAGDKAEDVSVITCDKMTWQNFSKAKAHDRCVERDSFLYLFLSTPILLRSTADHVLERPST